jgi:hypothetical protein
MCRGFSRMRALTRLGVSAVISKPSIRAMPPERMRLQLAAATSFRPAVGSLELLAFMRLLALVASL